jgi:small subunit ribosomal protein S17e
LNKIRRLAEELVTRYPSLFGPDFNKNKAALAEVTVVRTRSLRNQLAGAITKIVHEKGTAVLSPTENASAKQESLQSEPAQLATIEERARIEGTSVPKLPSESESKEEQTGLNESVKNAPEVAENSVVAG